VTVAKGTEEPFSCNVCRAGKVPGAGSPFPGWEMFLPQFVHPVKVAVVEALLWIGQPVSAAQFTKLFGGAGAGFREPNVRYHVRHLVTLGVLEAIPPGSFGEGNRTEQFVYFAGQSI
jgi:hypothetical protein